MDDKETIYSRITRQKKLAVLGSSSVIVKQGFGKILKEFYDVDCDLYFCCLGTSLSALYELLRGQINGNYDYVLIATNMQEEMLDYHVGNFPKEYVITYLYGIFSICSAGGSVPILLVLPRLLLPYSGSTGYIYRALAEIWNIPVLDFEEIFSRINSSSMVTASDKGHYYKKFYTEVANSVIEVLKSYPVRKLSSVEPEINFSLLNLGNSTCAMIKAHKSTSALQRTVYEFKSGMQLAIPDDKYAMGINYWNEGQDSLLVHKTRAYTLCKNLNVVFTGDLTVPIGRSVIGGVPGGVFSLADSASNSICEDHIGTIPLSDTAMSKPLLLSTVILSDANPFDFGRQYYLRHAAVFDRHRHKQDVKSVIHAPYSTLYDFYRANPNNMLSAIHQPDVQGPLDAPETSALALAAQYVPDFGIVMSMGDASGQAIHALRRNAPCTAVIFCGFEVNGDRQVDLALARNISMLHNIISFRLSEHSQEHIMNVQLDFCHIKAANLKNGDLKKIDDWSDKLGTNGIFCLSEFENCKDLTKKLYDICKKRNMIIVLMQKIIFLFPYRHSEIALQIKNLGGKIIIPAFEIAKNECESELSAEDVINAYKFVLGRLPENEEVILSHLKHNSCYQDLHAEFIDSDEFKNIFQAIAHHS